MTTPSPDDLCGGAACVPSGCSRAQHAYGYARGEWRYLRCQTHRTCREFHPADPPPPPAVPQAAAVDTGEVQRLRAEIAGFHEVLAAQWARTVEATDRWRAEDPTGRAHVMPDAGDLVAWLMADADRARTDLAAVEEAFAGLAAQRLAEDAAPPLAVYRTWWCPICGSGHYRRDRACCGTARVHAQLTIRRAE